MTLHPDVLTDLVILYHAGEASQASRALLEAEAAKNPTLASALAAAPRAMPPLPRAALLEEGQTFRKVRHRYQKIAFAVVWSLALLLIIGSAIIPSHSTNMILFMNAVPFLLLVLFFAGAMGALYFFTR